MASRKKRSFTPAFKADAVKLCRAGDQSIRQVAKNFDVTETVLREWVKRAESDAGRGAPEDLSSSERDELARLRRDNKRLLMERDILKKAAAFFAKENA